MLPCGVDVDGSCTKQMWIKMYIGAVMHRPLEGDRNLFIFVISTIHLGEEKRLSGQLRQENKKIFFETRSYHMSYLAILLKGFV